MKNCSKLLLMVVITIILSFASSSAFADQSDQTNQSQIKLIVNNQEIQQDISPIVVDGRTFFSVRILANALGVKDKNVLWDAKTQGIYLLKGDKVIQLNLGSTILIVNEVNKITMDVAPQVSEKRIMLPASYVANVLGYNVNWDGERNAVVISGGNGSSIIPSTSIPNSTTNTNNNDNVNTVPSVTNNTTNTTINTNSTTITTPSTTNTDTTTTTKTKVDARKEELKAKYLKDLEELKTKLDNTLKEKNKKVLTKQENGSWKFEWCVDQEAVDKAQKAYDKKLEQYNKLLD